MTSIIIPGPQGDDNANLIIRSTSHLALPSGDSTSRNVTGYTNDPGVIRYNTDIGALEYYKDTIQEWVVLLDIPDTITAADHNKPLYLDSNGKVQFQKLLISDISDIITSGASNNNLLVKTTQGWESKTIGGDVSVTVTPSNIDYSLNSSIITGKTTLNASANDDVLLIYDNDASSLKKITKSNFLTGYLTSVPTATTSTLGIVKPDGSTVSIDSNGTLSVGGSGGGSLLTADGVTIVNNGGTISAATATSSAKGIVRPDNSTITISSGTISAATATSSAKGIVRPDNSTITISNGVISAVAVSGLESRNNISQSVPAGTNNINFTNAYKSYLLLKVQTSNAAWVTLYTDNTSRSNDSGRSQGTDPGPGSGVIAEVVTTGNQTILMTPGTFGFNNDSSPSTTIYAKVVNTNAITLTLTIVKLEN